MNKQEFIRHIKILKKDIRKTDADSYDKSLADCFQKGLNEIVDNILVPLAETLDEPPAQEGCGTCNEMNGEIGDIQLCFYVNGMPEVPEYKSRMPIKYCPDCGRKLKTEVENG